MSRGARIGMSVAAVVAAVVLFVVLKPSDEDDSGGKDGATQVETTAPADGADKPKPKPKPEFDEIEIAGGQPTGGVKGIEVGKGETVRLVVSSADTGGEVHIHGYDVSKHLEAGGQVRFVFKTSIEGIFEVELEETATPLAELRVSP